MNLYVNPELLQTIANAIQFITNIYISYFSVGLYFPFD